MLAALVLIPSTDIIDVNSLLREMTDLSALARRPKHPYKALQASSYDRKSVAPDKPDWFANDDWGQYIRDEVNGGRKEHVMADITGPGTITRLWSANPSGTIRFYFDGSNTPGIEANMADLFAGKVPPFNAPFGYGVAHGHDVYFPIPFAKGLKVTVDDNPPGADHLYYHVGYRVYEPGIKVKTFRAEDVRPDVEKEVAKGLTPTIRFVMKEAKHTIWPEASIEDTVTRNSPGEVRQFQLRIFDPDAASSDRFKSYLRDLTLTMDFDGERCVAAPVGDFFGSVPGVHPYEALPIMIDPDDGTFYCRFVMPFKRSLHWKLTNLGKLPVQVFVALQVEPARFDSNTYYFHAQWKPEIGSTRPTRDMEFLNVKGEGLFVGCAMAERNPVLAWWGEGDEKIYVDGEKFPSTFGTGTEDYFGYAWSSNEFFQAPYHGQPYAQGPINFGYACQHRWQIFDAVPYNNSLRFDMELWHWADVPYSCWTTTYWYAKPGGTPPLEIDRKGLELKALVAPQVQGAIEGENMKVIQATGGQVTEQGFENLSNFAQLWWRDARVGDSLTLEFEAPEEGVFHVLANCCQNHDYGHFDASINGTKCGVYDFYSTDLQWKILDFGSVPLRKGPNRLTVHVLQPNAKAEPRNMFGLDYLLLKKE